MRDFLNRHSYLIIWLSGLIIIGAAAILVLQLNSIVPALTAPTTQPPAMGVSAGAQPPATPQPPSITFTVQKSKTGNSFIIRWQNLPNGTVALNIFRGKTGSNPADWSLWKSITVPNNELSAGTDNISIGNATEAGYSFYAQAVNGNENASGTSQMPQDILWSSSSIIPAVATSTPSQSGGNPTEPDQTPQNQNNTSTPTSTNQTPLQSPSSSTSDNGQLSPTGTPYYTPQIQISGYGSEQSGNFWVQSINEKIEFGWQDLPAQTTAFVIYRSQNQTGPWTTIFTQQNPSISGGSIQIVDNTIGQPYYYELTSMNGANPLATYGPAYLAAP